MGRKVNKFDLDACAFRGRDAAPHCAQTTSTELFTHPPTPMQFPPLLCCFICKSALDNATLQREDISYASFLMLLLLLRESFYKGRTVWSIAKSAFWRC